MYKIIGSLYSISTTARKSAIILKHTSVIKKLYLHKPVFITKCEVCKDIPTEHLPNTTTPAACHAFIITFTGRFSQRCKGGVLDSLLVENVITILKETHDY